jgi:DegV family protein with EDD domain
MARPTILVVDSDDSRRKSLARGLAELGYEVVSARDEADGVRFAKGLGPSVIVADAAVPTFGSAAILEELGATGGQTLLIVLGGEAGEEEEGEDEERPAGLLRLPVAGLSPVGVLRKVHTALVGVEVGLEADSRFESLLGTFQRLPLFDLLPELKRTVVSGRLVMEEGEIGLEAGEVIAARSGKVRGVKAFARIARTAAASFRLLLGPSGATREIKQDLVSLIAVAIEDQHRFEEATGKLPDLASRARLEMGPAFFSTQFSPSQQALLALMQQPVAVWRLVDSLPAPDGEVLEELWRLQQMGFVTFEEPEYAVRILTDSTADLPPELALRHGIHVIPLSVIFGEEILRDGIDITPGKFYQMLEARKDVHPRTSPPSKGSFLADYAALLRRYDVVSVHISEKMSLTAANAREARDELESVLSQPRADGTVPTLEIVNSKQVSTGLGLMALFAARMARRGLPAAEIRRRLEVMRERFHLLFVVDTLDYFVRGGRIGRARGLIGNLLGIKPILGLVEGEVTPIDKVRQGKAAHPKVVELLKQRVDPEKPVFAGIGHASAPVWSGRLRELLEKNFKIAEFILNEIGPVVGTHTGPGCVGVVMFQPTEEETPLIEPLPTTD